MSQEIPLWLQSPSAFSIIQITILTLVGTYWLWNGPYKSRWKSFAQSAFTVALMFVLFDTVYCIFIVLRFLPTYPQDTNLMILSIARDLVAVLFFYLLTYELWARQVIKISWLSWIFTVLNVSFLAIWIFNAPSIEWVNAQQAYTNNPPILWKTILLGHGLGRVLNTGFWVSLWKH